MYNNLDWVVGNSAVPGIRPVLYAIPKSDIAAWPSFIATPTTAAEEVTYSGGFTLVTNKTWKRINCIDIKSPVTCEPQGEPRSKTFMNKGTFVTALTNEEATAMAKSANNDDMVYIAQEKTGKYRVLGNELFSTETKVTQNLGAAPTDEVGTIFNIEVSDLMPAPFFDHEIVTDDGIVNPQS